MNPVVIDVASLAETEALGQRLAQHLFPGAVLALIGPLGAGKTHFVRAIAIGLGIANSDIVTSPTFVLIQEYEARLPIYHFDAYRLSTQVEFADLGVHEYFQGDGVCLIEWADKVPAILPSDRLEVRITITGEQARRFEFLALGHVHEPLIEFHDHRGTEDTEKSR
jgi:tRNA threonylcarbamoyladenosine biosynthesis protein TsaE